MRRAISSILEGEPGLQVVGTAINGEHGLEKIAQLKPDLVTMDIEMPVLDGLGALEKLRTLPAPRPAVLVCSTLTSAGSHAALKAMRLGAVDYIEKDIEALGAGKPENRRELLAKVRAIIETRRFTTGATASARPAPASTTALPTQPPDLRARNTELIVIGSSTGGPPVLEQLLSALPADLRMPVVIAQHMPALFTRSMAERFNTMCKVPVVHAEAASTPLQPGSVYIIVGGRHGAVCRKAGKLTLDVSDEPRDAVYKPSADALLGSAAQAFAKNTCGIILTGMGADGAKGARQLHQSGGVVLAQNAASCAVFGMPRSVIEANAATAVCDPDTLARLFAQLGGAKRQAA
jgi:two-component system chemotaxis response regulator CheB